jgi:hypothetical protein
MTATARFDFEITGTLLENAEARHSAVPGGPLVPCLCFVLQAHSATGALVRVHQLFPQGHERQCEARAHELRKGCVVTIEAPSVGIELVVNNANHVHMQEGQQPAATHEAAHA